MKTSEFTHIKEGIGSTHQGILESYTRIFRSNSTQARRQSMVEKAEDTIYQRHHVSEEKLTSLFNMKDIVG